MKTVELITAKFDTSGLAQEVRTRVGHDKVKKILKGFEDYFNQDQTIIRGVQAILLKRLKYSTGRLANSFDIKCKINYRQKRGVTGSIKSGETFEKKERGIISEMSIVLILKNPMLINALLGEEDAKTPVPSISAITDWVRGKKRYFREQIKDIQKRNRILQAARFQRSMLTRDKKLDTEIEEPTSKLAKRIVQNMKRRFENKDSATKGSEYTLLGYKEVTTKSGINLLTARYKKYKTPILSFKSDTLDEISSYINMMLREYAENTIYATHFTKGMKAKEVTSAAKEATFDDFLEVFDNGIDFLHSMIDGLSGIKVKGAKSVQSQILADLRKYQNIQSRLILDSSRNMLDSIVRSDVKMYGERMQKMALMYVGKLNPKRVR